MKLSGFIGLVAIATTATSSLAAVTTFASDPFAGSTALTTPGRQVVATNELFLSSFDITSDVFAVDSAFFNIGPTISFGNSLASQLPVSGLNVVVIQDTDNDNDPATAFNAGAAANLIAARITTPGAGLFIYWNSSLSVNRLVYSTNLDDNTADLAVIARITGPTGSGAIGQLPLFSQANFQIVPAPGAAGLLAGAGVMAAWRRRR
jgi:hypothetical protein